MTTGVAVVAGSAGAGVATFSVRALLWSAAGAAAVAAGVAVGVAVELITTPASGRAGARSGVNSHKLSGMPTSPMTVMSSGAG